MKPPAAQQPIHDVAPPNDSVGNPEQFAHIPVHEAPRSANPIAGGTPVAAPEPAAKEAKPEEVDEKVLKDVNKEVKAASRKTPQPVKPLVAISVAILAAVVLSAAAVFAFRSS